MKRLVTVTIETRQVQIIRARRRPSLLWCAVCGTEAEWLTPEQAAPKVGLNPRWLYQQLEAARLPFIETTDGTPLVCLACVAKPRRHTNIETQ